MYSSSTHIHLLLFSSLVLLVLLVLGAASPASASAEPEPEGENNGAKEVSSRNILKKATLHRNESVSIWSKSGLMLLPKKRLSLGAGLLFVSESDISKWFFLAGWDFRLLPPRLRRRRFSRRPPLICQQMKQRQLRTWLPKKTFLFMYIKFFLSNPDCEW